MHLIYITLKGQAICADKMDIDADFVACEQYIPGSLVAKVELSNLLNVKQFF